MTIDRDCKLELGFLISDTARLLRRVIDQRAKAIGMSRAQWALLSRIARGEGLRQVDLAAQMEMEPISVGRLVDKLQAAGLVERRADPDDRRAYRLHLLPAAAPVLKEVRAIGAGVMRQALAKIDDEQLNSLTASLEEIRANLVNIENSSPDNVGQKQNSAA